MKCSNIALVIVLVVVLVVFPSVTLSRHISRPHSHHSHRGAQARMRGSMSSGGRAITRAKGGPDTVEIAGSSLPDCSHACGSCSPCRLVMVSFVCATLEEAETCPMAYKCMCKNKSYPVP